MNIKLILSILSTLLASSIIFLPKSAILGTKLVLANRAVAQKSANILSQNAQGENQGNFQPRDRKEDEKYKGRMIGAGSFQAGGCPSIDPPPLTAFVTGDGTTSYRVTTAEQAPTLWFYSPYSKQSVSNLSAEFKLMDNREGRDLWTKEFVLEEKGIFPIQIPQEKLQQFDNNYYWRFKIICKQTQQQVYVNGYIKRVMSPRSAELIDDMEPEDKTILYAQNGLWLEFLTTYINEICPEDAEKAKDQIKLEFNSKFIGLGKYSGNYVNNIIKYCNPNSMN
ncbi:MAG: DUF928 domain-containing protein [Symploca sp. SIO2E9]|nr:DUF928 domain-containing protein [Symploca sp. SIO2E9]